LYTQGRIRSATMPFSLRYTLGFPSSWPKTITLGKVLILNISFSIGDSSVLTFIINKPVPLVSFLICSRCGRKVIQAGHQGAKNSKRTGPFCCMSMLRSLTLTMEGMVEFLYQSHPTSSSPMEHSAILLHFCLKPRSCPSWHLVTAFPFNFPCHAGLLFF